MINHTNTSGADCLTFQVSRSQKTHAFIIKLADFGLSRDLEIYEDSVYHSSQGMCAWKWSAPVCVI
jgi:hypothetical protein